MHGSVLFKFRMFFCYTQEPKDLPNNFTKGEKYDIIFWKKAKGEDREKGENAGLKIKAVMK